MSAEVIEIGDHIHVPSEPRYCDPTHSAEVRMFTPKIALCARCGSSSHRAHRCPKRPRTAAARDYIQTD